MNLQRGTLARLTMTSTLDLGLISNCQIGKLRDVRGEIIWRCLSRFDGDPAFCPLLHEHNFNGGHGYCIIQLVDQVKAEQSYLSNFVVLVTRLIDAASGIVKISDFVPRFHQHGRLFNLDRSNRKKAKATTKSTEV